MIVNRCPESGGYFYLSPSRAIPRNLKRFQSDCAFFANFSSKTVSNLPFWFPHSLLLTQLRVRAHSQ